MYIGQIKMSEKTPIQEIKSPGNNIYIKRDDLYPYSFGGNKARKGKLFFDKIDKGKYDCVVTYGSSSSNHCRIIANSAAARGIPCYIIGPKESSNATFNSKMMKLFGAEITVVSIDEVHDTIENKLQQLRGIGRKPFFIPGGGHGNTGTQAYVDCYREICDYERENNIHFDYIFHASGTGTTQAGLICGKLINRDEREIIGISIARKCPRGRDIVVDSVKEYLSDNQIIVSDDDMDESTVFVDDYTGDGYGTNNAEINQIIVEMMINHGIPMDGTYTAKAYNGMKKFIKKKDIKSKNILFIHTGGTPLFFDDLERLE